MLFFSDFQAYNEFGRAIIGARYQKLDDGPAARALVPVRDELVREGALAVKREPTPRGPRTVTLAQRHAHQQLFTADELRLVDRVISWIRPMTAKGASIVSHQEAAGWNLVEMQEDIPYNTALISTKPPSAAAVSKARELTARFGW